MITNISEILDRAITDSIYLCRYIGEVSSGIQYLHSRNLVHLDVKPSNILVSSHGNVKLADFGCCRQVGERLTQVISYVFLLRSMIKFDLNLINKH